jgi:hypothetical protein
MTPQVVGRGWQLADVFFPGYDQKGTGPHDAKEST